MTKADVNYSLGIIWLLCSFYFFSISCFTFFIYSQISVDLLLTGSSRYELISLFLFIFSSSIFLAISALFKQIKLSKIFLISLIFPMFVAIRSLYDSNNFSYFLEYTIRPTGGLFLYLFLGIFLVAQQELLLKLKLFNSAKTILYFKIVFSLLIILLCFFQIFSNISSEIFLLDVLEGRYQKPGNLLTVLIISIQVSLLNIQKLSITTKLGDLLFFFVSILAAIASQAFGSNTGFIIIAFLTINYFSIKLIIKNRFFQRLFERPMPYEMRFMIFSKSFVLTTFWQVLFVITFIVIFLIIALGFFFEFFSLFRIFGYGDLTSYDSISSRYQQIANFFPQFAIGTIFGNLESDSLTTGSGTYPHSFILSLLTHTGLFGFTLFFLFFLFYTNRLFNLHNFISDNERKMKIYGYYIYTMIFGLLVYSSLATFFTWPPIWFLIGITMKSFRFE